MTKFIIKGIITLTLGGFILTTATMAAQSDKATYVGPKKCKMCHINQFKSWEENMPQHENALKSLPADKQKDPNCTKCHVTGLGKESGYKDEATTPDLAGVTCEACHGPGSEHVAAAKEQKKDTITKVPVCTTCHNPHVSNKKLYGKS
jgi:hypothetical protein